MTRQFISESTRGVFVIAATPFTEDGSLDLASTDSLIDFYLQRRVHGITILGMMGEAPKLSDDETLAFVKRVLSRVDGRVPVVVGVSTAGLNNLVRLSDTVMGLGAAGVMIAPPSGLRTETHVLDYFDALFDALPPSAPVCLQDYPTSTGVYVSVETFHQLVDRHANLVMLKHEDFPALRKLTAIRRAAEHGEHRRVSILVANAGLYYPLEMRRGADGVMTGFAYPEMLVDVFDSFEAGEEDAAEDRYDAYLPILRYEYQIGIGLAIRKEILRRRGAIACARTRQPGPALNEDEHAELTTLMRRLEAKLSQLPQTPPPKPVTARQKYDRLPIDLN